MVDSRKLNRKIKKQGLKMKNFAKEVGISYCALHLKINNGSKFTNEEIERICTILEIDSIERDEIFFKRLC